MTKQQNSVHAVHIGISSAHRSSCPTIANGGWSTGANVRQWRRWCGTLQRMCDLLNHGSLCCAWLCCCCLRCPALQLLLKALALPLTAHCAPIDSLATLRATEQAVGRPVLWLLRPTATPATNRVCLLNTAPACGSSCSCLLTCSLAVRAWTRLLGDPEAQRQWCRLCCYSEHPRCAWREVVPFLED